MPLETYNLGVTTSSKEIDRVFNYLTLVSTQENFYAKNEKVIINYMQYELMLHLCPRKFKVKKLFINTGQ